MIVVMTPRCLFKVIQLQTFLIVLLQLYKLQQNCEIRLLYENTSYYNSKIIVSRLLYHCCKHPTRPFTWIRSSILVIRYCISLIFCVCTYSLSNQVTKSCKQGTCKKLQHSQRTVLLGHSIDKNDNNTQQQKYLWHNYKTFF